MKQITKKSIQENFLSIIEHKQTPLNEHQKWILSNDLADSAYKTLISHNDAISTMYNASVVELEQHKKQFRDHIELLDKNTRIMLDNFKSNGFVKIETDRRGGKERLVGKTTMVDEMVKFLNILNESVMEFYQKVYKIEEGETLITSDIKQTTLF